MLTILFLLNLFIIGAVYSANDTSLQINGTYNYNEAPGALDIHPFSMDKYNTRYHTHLTDNIDTSRMLVIYSKGQSGSTFLGEVIANMLKTKYDYIGKEVLGQDIDQVKVSMRNPLDVLFNHFRNLRKTSNGYIGYKQKISVFSPIEFEVYKWWALHKIPVIYSERNPLDLVIAVTKHHQNSLGYHCETKDCAEEQKNVKVEINTKDLISRLQELDFYYVKVKYFLQLYKVRHIRITYEDITYKSDDYKLKLAKTILKFIDKNNNYNPTKADFASSLLITSDYDHSKVIKNFEQVKSTLLGTPYYGLIHTTI